MGTTRFSQAVRLILARAGLVPGESRFIVVGNIWAYAVLILGAGVVQWLHPFSGLCVSDAQFALSAIFQGALTLLGFEVAALIFRLPQVDRSTRETATQAESIMQAAILEGLSAFVAAAASIILLAFLSTVPQAFLSTLVVVSVGLAVLSVANGMASFWFLFPTRWKLQRELAQPFLNMAFFLVTVGGAVLVARLVLRHGFPGGLPLAALLLGGAVAAVQVITLVRTRKLWTELRHSLERLLGRH